MEALLATGALAECDPQQILAAIGVERRAWALPYAAAMLSPTQVINYHSRTL